MDTNITWNLKSVAHDEENGHISLKLTLSY